MPIQITEANTQSLDDFIELADEVGEWLWNKGVKQWEPGEHQANRETLAHMVDNGCLILAYRGDTLVGGCILSEVIPPEWPDSPNVMAISKLAVARSVAGQNVGRQIVQGCVEAARQRGKSRIRLDCWEGNDFLKGYYQREGFTMLGIIQCVGYQCRLFDMVV